MSKKLNVSGVLNELRGSSVFFKKLPGVSRENGKNADGSYSLTSEKMQTVPEQSPTPPSKDNPSQIKPQTERTEFRTEKRSENRTVTLPVQRRTKRYSFEFYEDQILAIKKLKYDAEMAGIRVSLSDFAREALDVYLQEKQNRM